MAGLSPEERKKLKLKARKVGQHCWGPYWPPQLPWSLTPPATWSAALQHGCRAQLLLRIPYVSALRCTSATELTLLSTALGR